MKMPGNMQAMMKQAQQMQEKLQEEIALIRVEASAGGGMVTVKMDGQKNVLGVKIDPEVAGDVEMLQDMMMAAFNEAAKKVDEESKQKMCGMLGGLGLPPGLSKRCPTSPNRSPGLSRSSSACPASGRNPRSASRSTCCGRRAKTPSIWPRRCSTSRTSWGSARVCNNISDAELCPFCRDPGRDQSLICVVEEPHNIMAIETTRQFEGLYHVLHGAISPLRGIGPEQLRIQACCERLEARPGDGDHPRDQSHGGRRGHGRLSFEAAQAAGSQGDAHRDGRPGRQRSRIRRRSHDDEVVRKPQRDVSGAKNPSLLPPPVVSSGSGNTNI